MGQTGLKIRTKNSPAVAHWSKACFVNLKFFFSNTLKSPRIDHDIPHLSLIWAVIQPRKKPLLIYHLWDDFFVFNLYPKAVVSIRYLQLPPVNSSLSYSTLIPCHLSLESFEHGFEPFYFIFKKTLSSRTQNTLPTTLGTLFWCVFVRS